MSRMSKRNSAGRASLWFLHATGRWHLGRIALAAVALAFTSPATSQSHGEGRSTRPDAGRFENNVYHNEFFGLECFVPAGWVLQTPEMARGNDTAGKERVLLSAFARPPQIGSGVDPAILLAAEAQGDVSGADTPLEYLVAVQEAAGRSGMELAEPPRAIRAGGQVVWRADFTSEPGSALSRYQVTEVLLRRGYFVSYTVLATAQAEAEDLLAGLRLLPAKRSPSGQSH